MTDRILIVLIAGALVLLLAVMATGKRPTTPAAPPAERTGAQTPTELDPSGRW